jgi:hypothetical protein
MTSNEVLGRAVAMDEYIVTTDELQMAAFGLIFRPFSDDAVGKLTERIWADLIAIDPARAHSAWTQARNSKKSDARWLIKLAGDLPKEKSI